MTVLSIKNQQCVAQLNAGGVICYPTEAVWGLGCNPFNWHAVQSILELKNRPRNKGLILVASDIGQVDFLVKCLPQEKIQQLQQSWPGHVTWLIPHNNQIPSIVFGEHSTVAVRVSDHPTIKALCDNFNGPIVSTSANVAGKQPAKTRFLAQKYFGKNQIIFAAGYVGRQSAPSAIIDLMTGKEIR